MSTAFDRVRRAAHAEHTAESTRAQAEAAWRAAWWETNIALCQVTDPAERSAAMQVAADELGVSAGWLSSRRRAAALLADTLPAEVVASLPPRLSIEWARTGKPIDAVAAQTLSQAEQDGTSLRDFARQLGTQPRSWQREDERTDNTAATTVDQVRQALQDPQIREALASDRQFVRSFDQTRAERASRNISERGGRIRDEHEHVTTSALMSVLSAVTRARVAAKEAHDALSDVVLNDSSRPRVAHEVDLLEAWVEALKARVSGSTLDEAIAQLLEQEAGR